MNTTGAFRMTLLAGAAALSACSLHGVNESPAPLVTGGSAYSQPGGAQAAGIWYRTFNDPKLDALVEDALAKNLSVVQALARLDQADAVVTRTRAPLFPQLDGSVDTRKTWRDGDPQEGVTQLGGALDWEVDIFGRIRSAAKADDLKPAPRPTMSMPCVWR